MYSYIAEGQQQIQMAHSIMGRHSMETIRSPHIRKLRTRINDGQVGAVISRNKPANRKQQNSFALHSLISHIWFMFYFLLPLPFFPLVLLFHAWNNSWLVRSYRACAVESFIPTSKDGINQVFPSFIMNGCAGWFCLPVALGHAAVLRMCGWLVLFSCHAGTHGRTAHVQPIVTVLALPSLKTARP